MIGVKFTKDVNKYKDGGVIDVPYPYECYIVIQYHNNKFQKTKYDLSARFLQKALNYLYDDEIDLKQSKTDKEKKSDLVVLNGEEIMYETIESENKGIVIILISILSFVMLIFSCGIVTFINKQIEENRLKNEEISMMLNNAGKK